MRRFLSCLFGFIWLAVVCQASMVHSSEQTQQAEDNLRVSLLTCSPGNLIYELYGHTALRIQDLQSGDDWVFNYGVFDFGKPHFIWRFVKGETDYELGVLPYDIFAESYAMRGSDVVEQELNLCVHEKVKLYQLLLENYQKENRVYRYNFLYDNCTTRARDKIEESIDGTVKYSEAHMPLTYRDIIHRYTKNYPWSEFGQDILLGAEADRPITARQQMFAPLLMMSYADHAEIEAYDRSERKLVNHTSCIVTGESQGKKSDSMLFTPMVFFCLWLLLTMLVCLSEWRWQKKWWGYDLLLYGLQGLAGCVVTFLFFMSDHPTVGSNWLIIILNPLPLCYLPWMVYKTRKGNFDIFHPIAVTILTFFILSWPAFPQFFPPAIAVLALNLWVRSAAKIYLYKKQRSKQQA